MYTLIFAKIFHKDENHDSNQDRTCGNPRATTFIDDNMIIGRKGNNENMIDTVENILKKTSIYMNSNLLAQNNDKTQVMILSDNNEMKDQFKLIIGDKTIKHSKSVYSWSNSQPETRVGRLSNFW